MTTFEDVYHQLLDLRDDLENLNSKEVENYLLQLDQDERKYVSRIVELSKEINLKIHTPF